MTTEAEPRSEAVHAAVEAVQGWIARRQRAMVKHLHACGQSPAQLHLLGLLNETGPTTVSHIAAKLGTTPPSASTMIDRMVDAGVVSRERGEEDRRLVTVSLTAAGRDVLEAAIGGRREMLERVLRQLTDEELRTTVGVMARLEEALAAVTPVAPQP